jgi:predicted nucleic acid-binding protein
MNARYLVDTSVLARMTREPVRDRVRPIIESGEAATCSIIDLEVLFSARNHAEHERIRQRRRLSYAQVPITEEVFRRGMEVQGELAKRGQHRLPIPDLLVAAAAERAELTVLHYDAHFDAIAAVSGQPTEWVVPRGTVR